MVTTGIGSINDFLKQDWLHEVNHPLLKAFGVAADILRLDRIHPQVSGNKWLKLDYWFRKLREGSYKGILTAGGPWSNHLHACAYACKLHGIQMHALVKGYEGMGNPMLQDLVNWKVMLQFKGRKEFYNAEIQAEYASKNGLLFIPMGGEGEEGVAGVKEFFNHLPLECYNEVFCPVGTGTTLAGIAASNHPFPLITGTDPGTGDLNLVAQIQKIQLDIPSKKIRLLQLGKRMGRLAPDIQLFMQNWITETGIPTDFVYTGPMFKLFLEMLAKNEFSRQSRILFVHTGGLQGNRSVPGLVYE